MVTLGCSLWEDDVMASEIRVDVYHHIVLGDAAPDPRIDDVLRRLENLKVQVGEQGEQMAYDFSDIADAVRDQQDVTQSAVTTLQQLSDRIADLQAQVNDPAIQAQLDDFATSLRASAQTLGDAIVANTPPTPEPPPEPTPTPEPTPEPPPGP